MKVDNEICIMGMGYVGLTLAVAMAKKGYIVHGVEIDERKLKLLNAGKPHFYETGLESLMEAVISNGALTFSREIPSKTYPVYIITVGTPLAKDTKIPRIDMIEKVSNEILEVMSQNSLVIARSTVTVGTTRNIILPILNKKIKSPQVAFCAERTIEGNALEEIFMLPQIIGAINEKSLTRAANIFHKITPTVVKVSSLETAEIIKLFDNIYRDIHFAISNEVAETCEILGIDGYEAIRASNLGYNRTNISLPGYVGGPCLEKDPYIFEYSLRHAGYKPKITMAARSLHEKLQGRIADRILKWTLNNNLDPKKAKVTLLGMAFKGIPETNDLRGAPSIIMIDELKNRGFENIFGHDFLVPEKEIENLNISPANIIEAFNKANIIIIMNNNLSYKKLNISDLIKKMARPAYFMDSWNMFDFEGIAINKGVYYGSIGRS